MLLKYCYLGEAYVTVQTMEILKPTSMTFLVFPLAKAKLYYSCTHNISSDQLPIILFYVFSSNLDLVGINQDICI